MSEIDPIASSSAGQEWDAWPRLESADDLTQLFHAGIFLLASVLTDPVCKSHELFRRYQIVEASNPTASKISIWGQKCSLLAGAAGFGALGVVAAPFGIAFRSLGLKHPFVNLNVGSAGKTLPSDRTFSLLSWNICCAGAGYAITDGGVMPWPFRIDAILSKIIEQDADVNCLYEVFDIKTACMIANKLKAQGYLHFYFNMGPKSVGVSSGIFVASKYKIENPEFTYFPQDTLVGRTKGAGKGVFAFDLQSSDKSFARIFTTHLQHSEECIYPTDEEKEARRRQMEILIGKMDRVKDKCLVVTGDLNLDDEEYFSSAWQSRFQKGDIFKSPPQYTWGGDEFCARLVHKRISTPLNLDHTMIVPGTAQGIVTTLVETDYAATKFLKEALSDHAGLFSRITV